MCASHRPSTIMAEEDEPEVDTAAIAARFLAQAPPLQFPPVLDGALARPA